MIVCGIASRNVTKYNVHVYHRERVKLTDCPGSTLTTCFVMVPVSGAECSLHLAAVMEYEPGAALTSTTGVLVNYH